MYWTEDSFEIFLNSGVSEIRNRLIAGAVLFLKSVGLKISAAPANYLKKVWNKASALGRNDEDHEHDALYIRKRFPTKARNEEWTRGQNCRRTSAVERQVTGR